MNTQVDKMFNHLKAAGSITNRESFIEFGVQAFTRRVADLEAKYKVKLRRVRKTHPVTGQNYVRYYL